MRWERARRDPGEDARADLNTTLPSLLDAPISFLRGFSLPEASAAEDALHAVVGLVAGVLKQETVDDSHWQCGFGADGPH